MSKPVEQPGTLNSVKRINEFQAGWFEQFRQIVETEPYVISSLLIPREIYVAMDIPVLEEMAAVPTPKPAKHYFELLRRSGVQETLAAAPGGNAMAFAFTLDDPDKSRWNGLPPPALVVNTTTTTGPDRSGQALAEHYGIPHVGVEPPALRRLSPNWWDMGNWQWEEMDEPDRIDMLLAQYKDLVRELERISGRTMDYERLAKVVGNVNQQEEWFREIREITKTSPKMPYRMGDLERTILALQHERGTDWALDQARQLRDEVKIRADAQQWICPNERYRLMWQGSMARYWDVEFLLDLERSHGVVFARSLWLSIAPDGYIRYGGKDPLRALASRYTSMNQQAHIPPLGPAWAVHEAYAHRISGSVHQDSWEWYSFIAPALEEVGVPVLRVQAPPVSWDCGVMHQRFIEFIEQRVAPAAERLGLG